MAAPPEDGDPIVQLRKFEDSLVTIDTEFLARVAQHNARRTSTLDLIRPFTDHTAITHNEADLAELTRRWTELDQANISAIQSNLNWIPARQHFDSFVATLNTILRRTPGAELHMPLFQLVERGNNDAQAHVEVVAGVAAAHPPAPQPEVQIVAGVDPVQHLVDQCPD